MLKSVVIMISYSAKIRAIAHRLKNASFVVLGTLILALGTASFLIPFNLVSGGISGISIIFEKLFGGGLFSVEIMITVLTWTAFFIGLLFLGKSFALKTLLSSALYPLFISLMIEAGLADFFTSLLPSGIGLLIAALLGGALVGLGLGLSFIGGGSTGGVDILALVLCKKNPRFKMPRVVLFIDCAVILIGALVISSPKTTFLGILSAVTAAFTIQSVLGTKRKIFNTNPTQNA